MSEPTYVAVGASHVHRAQPGLPVEILVFGAWPSWSVLFTWPKVHHPEIAFLQGQNLVLNMNDKGFTVVAANRTSEKVKDFLENEAKGTSSDVTFTPWV